MGYKFKNYWEDLKKSLENFDRNDCTQALNDEDKISYETAKAFLVQSLALGLELERTPSIRVGKKMQIAKEMDELAKKYFDQDELPQIKGEKSLAFIQKVYLPYLDRFQKLNMSSLTAHVGRSIGFDLDVKKQHLQGLANCLQQHVSHYIADTSGQHTPYPASVSLLSFLAPSARVSSKEEFIPPSNRCVK